MKVSEIFYSLQGEGTTTGKPSIFLRLTACNLMCGGRGTEKDGKLHNGATWRCDTIEVWLKGEAISAEDLAVQIFEDYKDEFRKGAQLVITGGEPLLQQKQLIIFMKKLDKLVHESAVWGSVRTEIETNGTIKPLPELVSFITQFNISPKLKNSGMEREHRIKPDAIQFFKEDSSKGGAIFKFVISSKEDMYEMINEYIAPFNIPHNKIWLMPGCSNRQQYAHYAPIVADLCKENGFNFSGRLQINIWDEVTGV